MNKNIILYAAIGAAVLLVLNKRAQATGMTQAQKQQSGLLYTPTQQQSVNLNGDMWTRLLGDSWRTMVGAQNGDGSEAFIKKNGFGQVTTSDGKPLDSGDPVANYVDAVAGFAPFPQNSLAIMEPITSSLYAPIEW